MHKIKDLDGTNIARGKAGEGQCTLTIMAPSGFADTGFYPAESITLNSLEAVAGLRELCEQLIEAHAEANQEA